MTDMVSQAIDLQDLREAHERIAPYIHRTPVARSRQLNELFGCELYFKCENMQRIGAFKIRGASNAVLSLSDDDIKKGVATHSSGNHAQALALAASFRNAKATIVMPENAPEVKKNAVRGYGGNIIFCKPTTADREATLQRFLNESGAMLVHPYNDYRVITGQATAAVELIGDCTGLDYLLAPVGGGGLLSGTSLAAAHLAPATKVIGVEPAAADDAFRSIRDGKIHPSDHPNTIADGLLTSLGDKTFDIISRHTSEILTVSEENIRKAMRLLMERMKLVVEPSGAVTLACILEHPEKFRGKKTGLIISGGNLDLSRLSEILKDTNG